jgi:hypothetical protein
VESLLNENKLQEAKALKDEELAELESWDEAFKNDAEVELARARFKKIRAVLEV